MCHAFYFWVVKRRTRRESSMISIPALRSNAKLERVRWGHCLRWKETLRTDTCLWSADDWPHQQLLMTTNISSSKDMKICQGFMKQIYEGFRPPRKVLLFDFDSTELEVLLKGQALCNEIDVQFSQRWKDYEWNENWWNIMTAIMTLKSKFNLNNSNDHEHHYHHKYHPPLYQ